MLHQQVLVVGQQGVLAVVPLQPLRDERGVQVYGVHRASGQLGPLDLLQLLRDHVQGQRAFGDLAQVVHAVDELEQLVDVGVGDVDAQVLPDLGLAEREHQQGQVIPGGGAVPVLAGEVGRLVADRPEVVGAARQQQTAGPVRLVLLVLALGPAGTLPGVLRGPPQDPGEPLPLGRVQVHQHFVQTVEDQDTVALTQQAEHGLDRDSRAQALVGLQQRRDDLAEVRALLDDAAG